MSRSIFKTTVHNQYWLDRAIVTRLKLIFKDHMYIPVLQTAALIGIFILMAALMFLRKLPALIALPLMAFAIAFVGGVAPMDIIQYVIGVGTIKLHNAYTIALFGSMLSVILQKTGVAESFIKKGAELAGDNPWAISIIMLSLITLLFSTLGGLGAIIMVATIVLPIMSSVGVGPVTSVGIFLFGLSIGGIINVGNWAVYISVMGLKVPQIRPFAMVMLVITFICAVIYITIQLYRDGHAINITKVIVNSLICASVLALGSWAYSVWVPEAAKISFGYFMQGTWIVFSYIVGLGIALLFLAGIIRIFKKDRDEEQDVHWISYFAPIIPLLLILLFNVDIIASFITGLLYAYITTYKKGRMNLFIRSCFEGGGLVMPAVVLMFGIGMLLVAIMGPGTALPQYPDGWPVIKLLQPLMLNIVPKNPLMYVVIFSLAAPLALYRGPLNVWGMGYGLAAVLIAAGLNPGAVMGLLLAVGQIQGISDPTNTHNVWLANEMRVDVQKLLWNTIPYTWAIALFGLIASAFMFM